jgi:cation-transporting ATPase E
MSEVIQGLTSAEVQDRVIRGQVNRVPSSIFADYAAILRRNLLTLFNLLVIPPAIGLFAVGEIRGGIALSGMALATSALGLIQEIRGRRLLRRLALLQMRQVRVLRDGKIIDIRPSDVVQDDVLPLQAGETVVADGPVLQADYLELDESLLTGESEPHPHQAGETLLSGSACVSGTGYYRATSVGRQAFAQQITLQATDYRHALIPFQRALNRFLNSLTVIAIALCILYLALSGPLAFRRSELFLMIGATITSMVPQGLILLASLAFTLSAVRLSMRGAVVQELNAVESMAAVTVLCLDKTGTLTTGRLRLAKVLALDQSVNEEEVRRRLLFFAQRAVDQSNRTIMALRSALGELSVPAEWAVTDQVPFHSARRFSAIQCRRGDEGSLLVLGAPEALAARLDEQMKNEIQRRQQPEMATGARLLLFAESPRGVAKLDADDVLGGNTLRPLGFVILGEELRPDAADILGSLIDQRIRVKVLSGDSPETITRLCAALPLPREPAISGGHLKQEGGDLVESTTIFGRLTPQQKVGIIKRLQADGEHVAMLGDGVNDVLAIKQADLGLAMGSGTEAAQTVAGMVLKHDRFDLLLVALAEGRRVIASLIQAAQLFFLKNVYMLLLFLGALLVLRVRFPIVPQQVTLLNVLTIAMPTFVVLGTQPSSKSAMQRRTALDAMIFVLTRGVCMGIGGVVLLAISAYWRGDYTFTQRSLLVTALIVHGLAVVVQLGLSTIGGARRQGILLLLWPPCAVLLYMALLAMPATAHFFELRLPDVAEWTLIIGAVICSLSVATLLDYLITTSVRTRPAG